MSFVYLDTETTGLTPYEHEVWEVAYAVDNEPIVSSPVPHTGRNADPAALEMNGYRDRAVLIDHWTGETAWRVRSFEDTLRTELDGATLVGANPAFDAAFLRARWGYTPWKYRLLDIEAYAMPLLGLAEPRGLAYIAEQLGIQAPNHTAAGDVHTLRECHRELRRRYDDALCRQVGA